MIKTHKKVKLQTKQKWTNKKNKTQGQHTEKWKKIPTERLGESDWRAGFRNRPIYIVAATPRLELLRRVWKVRVQLSTN